MNRQDWKDEDNRVATYARMNRKFWDKQMIEARRVLYDHGVKELHRHALVSIRHEGPTPCNDCFCCAARMVYYKHLKGEV